MKNPKNLKKIPDFKSEAEEKKFWLEVDSVEYIDWSQAKPAIFPNLKPTTKLISIRLPEYQIDRLKVKANKISVPYQALIKQYIEDGLVV